MQESNTGWNVFYSDEVVKTDIATLDQIIKKRIKKAIETKLMADPIHFGKPLQYSLNNLRSLRVGDYRILYAINHNEKSIFIVSIGHRKNVYIRHDKNTPLQEYGWRADDK